jgi:hypothetical protein
MLIPALTNLLACIATAMIGGYAAAEIWGLAFLPSSAGCLFLLALVQNFRP